MRHVLRPLVLVAVLAATLSAAAKDDIVGSWIVDGEASWAAWQDRPEMAKVPADMRDTLKKSVLEKLGGMSIEITPTEITRTDATRTETSSYKVLSSEGDTETIESKSADGTASKGRLELKDGRLRIMGIDDAGQATAGTLVLRRRTAADGAKPDEAKPKADAPARVVTTPTE